MIMLLASFGWPFVTFRFAVCNVPFCMGQPVLGLEHLLRTLHPDCASVDGTLVVGREIFHWPELSKVMVCGEHTPCQRDRHQHQIFMVMSLYNIVEQHLKHKVHHILRLLRKTHN